MSSVIYLIQIVNVSLIFLSACQEPLRDRSKKHYIVEGNTFDLYIDKKNFIFFLQDHKGKITVPGHPFSGLVFSGSQVVASDEISKSSGTDRTRSFLVTNKDGDKAIVNLLFANDIITFEVNPLNRKLTNISLALGGMQVAHGLGDVGAYEDHFNLIKNEKEEYNIENNGGGSRWVSTFTIFPQNSMAGVFFDKGRKSVVLNDKEYRMNINTEDGATFCYFLGEPANIYKNYKIIRNREGYKDVKPKFRLFELGWESWDALGWNTNQKTVQQILQKFHDNNYPIRWAVTGSGFWEKGGTTTSFGRWGEKFSEAESFKAWMHDQDIKWMIGLRTNFIPDGGPFYPTTTKQDRNLKVNFFNGNQLSSEAKEKGFFVNEANGQTMEITSSVFPIVPSYLLDGNVPGAAQWYLQQYLKWGVDGIKEDTMMDIDSMTNIYNSPITEIADKGGLVMARNGEFVSPGTLLRINDTGVGQLSGRIPINYLQYAASGFPNVYSDVAGVHNMHNVKDIDKNIRHTWLLSLTSGLAVGAYPEKWSEDKQKIFKKAIDFHYALAPYMYSAAIDSYEAGYPFTLTPLTIAFPKDSLAAQLEHFEWMIGESVLATPLLKDHESGKMDIYLPKGTWFDYESGEKYEGPLMLSDFEMPLDKIPCFVGKKGIVVLRDSDQAPLKVKIYPIAKEETSFTFKYPSGKKQSNIQYKKWQSVKDLVVMDIVMDKEVPFKIDQKSGAISFEILIGRDYRLIENK